MRGHGLSGQVVALLDAHPAKLFADAPAWAAHLARLGIDTLLGLMKTCGKLKVSFYRYLGDRLHVPGVVSIPPLPDLVRQAATPA